MRPLRLTMQAFGPYAGREVIDFTQLGNRTMFVISGKTGAGKTTIFDAISYAIYGKASGEDRNGPELRSQFAADEMLTEVSLEFSLRNKVYFITRSPQQLKKKDKGDGVTQIGAKAELYTYEDGEKKLLASKIGDVEEKIKEIMLIDANQFRQILMIPQGEFRKLLTSDSKDKETILQRLFHTQLYKQVEERLKEEAAELKKSVEGQEQVRNEAIRRIQAITSEELRAYIEAGSVNDTIIMPLLQTEIAGTGDLIEKLNNQFVEKAAQQDKLKAEIFEAEGILKQLQMKEELKEQKSTLVSQNEIFKEKEKQIELAQKAALLAKQEELCHRLKRENDQLKSNVEAIKQEIENFNIRVIESEQLLQQELEREPERQSLLEEKNRLINIKEDVYSFTVLQKETREKEVELKATQEKQRQCETGLEELTEQISLLLQQKEEIEKGKLKYLENEGEISKLNAELDRYEKYEMLLKRYKTSVQDLKQITGEYENTTARYLDAKAHVEELELKWMKGQAAILAANLESGTACPVCGSEHHPSPASAHGDKMIPSEVDMKAAKEQETAIEKEKSMREASFYQAQSVEKNQQEALQELLEEIRRHKSDFSEDTLSIAKMEAASERDKLVRVQNKLTGQLKQLESVKLEISKKDTKKIDLQNKFQLLSAQVTELTVQFTEKKTNLTRMMKIIPEGLRSEAAYEKALAAAKNRHENLVKQLEGAQNQLQTNKEKLSNETARLKDALTHQMTKQQELDTERSIFIDKLAQQGFEKYGMYATAKRTEEDIRKLDADVRNYREELRSVSDRLHELTVLLSDVKTPNLESLKNESTKLSSVIEEINQKRTDLFIKKRDNEEIYTRIETINKNIKLLEERYKLIGHLSDIAKGQNNFRITFERYVLASFLDDILREANVRLRKMTSGRFQLHRKTDRSKGNAQSGLELLVFDQYTGQERHVKTLSGGESFKASLSLALGLADVVQNYAGGVSLETMFIDEGFGTLDPESLDQAIEALMDIQSSGRLVGIISHVPELKERIDVRLEVIADQTGSKTEFKFTN